MIESFISIAFYISTVVTLCILLLPSQYAPKRSTAQDASTDPKTTVQILVLGDIGRSPRMQYHALSIAKGGGQVEIIGYHESEIHPDISSDPRISIVALPPHPACLQTSNKLLFLVFGPLKVLFQVVCLWWSLAYRTRPVKWLLVQNPPSIPTLAVASLTCFLRQTNLIIDWHNFGYSILALKLGNGHPLVKLSKWYEKTFGRYATAHLCVTTAMTSVLKKEFLLEAPVLPLHDRPANHFRPILDDDVRQEFLLSLPVAASEQSLIKSGALRVLVSSTSWTADEDFSLLIDALCRYSELAATTMPELPQMLAIITGKGPQKEMYIKQIADLEKAGKLEKVTIRTAWLTTTDYAKLLASASLGVSLHTSSSGVDLPMKVVDMFGAGLPVVGWNRFEAWPELVTEGVNGRGFGSSDELVEELVELFGDTSKLDKLRVGAQKESTRRWDDEWNPVAGKLLGIV
ncbi:glycosyl transferases group 1-domain-containing protein [Aspergillus pseudonomiae]|uniref:Chitobiosyldiphosphodolichol beta-mannosyltransferase n=1 Tax=Aspergillus pseudonomiae TaxID=1506151 RepID=A0A5N7D6R5_9EURO|nr:glycosyl transferases group 1-domain-containing protein [Aspergillus pseudonomiae]KAB8256323.1 glycosyl transferases group 1-domain-containing protein [Aspergillus pseudonomiae]KAE8402054.1 glycosyl transferases group 1-domain-containing protein [Aspergillus pseudonomiae]